MLIPRSISVTVVQRGAPVRDALVWLNVVALGGDYFRTHVGLTDESGMASITGEQLRADFRSEQKVWPMDFKLPLEDCDDEIVVGVEGGDSFTEHRDNALKASWVVPEAKRHWALAVNAILTSATARYRLSTERTDEVSLTLEVS